MRSGLIVLATLVSLIVVAPARAGTYDVYSCRLPDGSPAPTVGWAGFDSENAELGLSATASNTCDGGGGLTASIPSYEPVGMAAGWSFTAPPATTIEGFEIFRAVRPGNLAQGGLEGYVASVGPWPPDVPGNGIDEQCLTGAGAIPLCEAGLGRPESALDQANRYQRQGLHAGRLTLGIGCWQRGSTGDPSCGASTQPNMVVFAAKLTLRDDSAPTVDVGLAEGSRVRGVVRVPATAADQGAGLTEVALVVDGAEVGRGPVDDLPDTCRPPFVEPAPCPSQRALSLPLDSRAFADGVHVVQVVVFDAVGNRSLSAPASVVVANVTPLDALSPAIGPNGRGATRFARLRAWLAGRSRRTDRTLAYGVTTSVEGQLTTSDGAPIRLATLQVEQRSIGVATAVRPVATVKTDVTGHFTYRVARGASRSVRFAYTAFPDDAGPVASAQVSVHVRAGVSLRASPARVRNGSVLTFRGRVLGERGTRRAVVTIYALSREGPRSRIPVETIRAAASGRFTYRYRFQSIPGPVVYRFEARVLKQTGFPYVEGASRPVAVHGRP
jgi:hypothetical protein